MNIAILGSGGREHAIAWRVLKDREDIGVFVIPGNSGMELEERIQCLEWDGEFSSLQTLLISREIEFVIVGPETLLERGVTDFIEGLGVSVLGPSQMATLFESSKSFSKEFMNEFNIPTARSILVSDYFKGLEDIDSWSHRLPPVVKASGLAAGKGVFVADTRDEAKEALYDIMRSDSFPVSDNEVLLEERLEGREVSSFALFDGSNYKVLGHCSDYKRLLDQDLGPNTGGMGSVCDEAWPSLEIRKNIEEKVFKRFKQGIAERGIKFKGILFAGLMVNDQDIKVIEFNVRFGDPETQSLLPCLKGDFLSNLVAAASSSLDDAPTLSTQGHCVHVVMASKGYPFLDKASPQFGQRIPLLSTLGSQEIFYAGVKRDTDHLVNTGGRVLGISSRSTSVLKARESVYQTIPLLKFNGAYWRSDIGN